MEKEEDETAKTQEEEDETKEQVTLQGSWRSSLTLSEHLFRAHKMLPLRLYLGLLHVGQ